MNSKKLKVLSLACLITIFSHFAFGAADAPAKAEARKEARQEKMEKMRRASEKHKKEASKKEEMKNGESTQRLPDPCLMNKNLPECQ